MPLADKKVVVRLDLNVPIEDGRILDFTRIYAVMPTLRYLLSCNNSLVLLSHLGRPKGTDLGLSLSVVAEFLSIYLQNRVRLIDNWRSGVELALGEVVLCENLRFSSCEESNDLSFARDIAKLGDVFVLDCFSVAHRKHASNYSSLKFAGTKLLGPLFNREVSSLKDLSLRIRQSDPGDLNTFNTVGIIGGSKISTKLALLSSLLEKLDLIVPGGAIANHFIHAKGYNIGLSLHEPAMLEVAQELLSKYGHKIFVPLDVVVLNKAGKVEIKEVDKLHREDIIFDFGPKTMDKLTAILNQSKVTIWNGPLGKFEDDRFAVATKNLVGTLATGHAYVAVGGGDTLAAINKFGSMHDFAYVSTGGGAFLYYLQHETFPCLEDFSFSEYTWPKLIE